MSLPMQCRAVGFSVICCCYDQETRQAAVGRAPPAVAEVVAAVWRVRGYSHSWPSPGNACTVPPWSASRHLCGTAALGALAPTGRVEQTANVSVGLLMNSTKINGFQTLKKIITLLTMNVVNLLKLFH